MAEGIDGYSGGEVEIFSVLNVPEVAAFAFDHHGRRADVSRYHVLGVLADDCGGLGIARWIRVWEGCFFLYHCELARSDWFVGYSAHGVVMFCFLRTTLGRDGYSRGIAS